MGSTTSKRRSAGAASGGKGGQLNVGEDSWGAASSASPEEALARVKQLEEQTAVAEQKRRAAEERALALSSQSAQLMKSKEEKEMHAKALEIQMEELAAARHADAMRSTRDIEAAAAQDTLARKALEQELNKERARRQEAEHQLDILRLKLQQEKVKRSTQHCSSQRSTAPLI